MRICAHCNVEFSCRRKLNTRWCSRACYITTRIIPPEARFWSKVEKTETCWNWISSKDPRGYGQFRISGKTIKAPRYAFFFAHGHWPLNALHHCDNPSCVNPDHLYNGTHKDNMRDKTQRGRNNTPKGDACAASRLTSTQVAEMRAEYKSGVVGYSQLARKYQCSLSTVQRTIKGQTWRHLLTAAQAEALKTK